MTAKKPLVLIVLDGWGYREAPQDNAIANANTPFWDELWATAPHMLVSGSGLDVGLPDGQMGNSEVGHMSLGAGRIIYQNITRIDQAIKDGSFFTNPAYVNAIDKAVAAGKAVHLLGLLSPGGVHSHESHIYAAAKLAQQRGAKKIFVHAILDGRDVPPRSAKASLQAMHNELEKLGVGRIASIIGRYYAMDRDNRWDRVAKAYNMLTQGVSEFTAESAVGALEAAYERDENDEFVQATCILDGQQTATIEDGDAVLFMNFRADRARELTRALVEPDFHEFERDRVPKLADFVMTTEYAADINTSCAFPPEHLANSFGELMEKYGKTQLRIAETEKYAHVTFFFSGGREQTFTGEDRTLIPSPDVATYDLKPEMSAPEVTDALVEAIKSQKYDAIICNYANGDMVGHTGIYEAAVKAVEAVDSCLKRVISAVREVDGDCLITADHGNCEQMMDYESGQHHTQHTTDLVPLIYIGSRNLSFNNEVGKLADIAPTMLELMDIEQPKEMTGKALLV